MSLAGKRILVTAGPTREAIDPVRYISNHSSGKMGYALARAAREAGAEVHLITGPTTLTVPGSVEVSSITTTAELARAVKERFGWCDGLIMAAAPADFRPVHDARTKIKRGTDSLGLELEPTQDILKGLTKERRQGQVVVGFALETDSAEKNARRKLREKGLDMIVLNVPGEDSGFDTETNRVSLIRPRRKTVTLPVLHKDEVARRIIEQMAQMF